MKLLEDKLKKEIIEKYGSVRQFALKIDVPYTTIDTILKRGIDNSNVSNVIKMCKELNISVDKLVNSKEIVSLLEFNDVTPIDTLSSTVLIPVLGTIKAGIPIETQQDIIEYIDIPREWTRGEKKFYGLKVKGDSMFPKYVENDYVIFEETVDYVSANNKDCAVMVNNFDATFKKVTINENGIMLTPFNLNNLEGYQPTFYTKEQVENLPVKIVGIAKEKRTRL